MKSSLKSSPGTWSSGRRRPREQSVHRRSERRHALLFLAPAGLLLIGVFLLPTLVTFVISLEPQGVNPTPSEVLAPENLSQSGLQNYERSLSDSVWLNSLRTTVIFGAGMTVLGVLVSLALAVLINRVRRGRAVLLALVLIPWAVPPVVSGTTWGLVVHGDIGTLNGVLEATGLIDTYQVWLGEPISALTAVIVATTWRYVPLMTLLLLAGLQQLERESYEAASVDGANTWQQFTHITLPGLRPMLLTVGVLSLIWSTKVFDEIWVLTGGGPANGTTVMNLWAYRQAFEFLRFGYGAALAYQLALATGVLAVLYFLVARRADR